MKRKKAKHKKTFETELIRLISTLLIILFLSVIVLYYSSMKSMYSEQLEKSNDSIIEQVAISFEMLMRQITDGIYKIPLYDDEIIRMVNSNQRDMLYQIELQRKLDNVVLGNSYLYSAYLYLPASNTVYTSEKANAYPLESFPDIAAIVLKSKGTISISDPRVVDSMQGRKLLISIVCPIPLYQGDYKGLLVVNIDANKLYYDVLKKIKTDGNMNFYVYNKDNNIVINKDASLLFKKYVPKEADSIASGFAVHLKNMLSQHSVIHSVYHSQELSWNFVLETSINSTSSLLTKLYSIGFSLIALLLLSLLIMMWIVKSSTKPVKKVLSSYNEKLWVDFLTDNDINSDEAYKKLELDSTAFTYDSYAIILLQLTRPDISHDTFNHFVTHIRSFTDTMKSICDANIIVIHKSQIAILINFSQKATAEESEADLVEYAARLYRGLPAALSPVTYLSVSIPKDSVLMLPISFRECIDSLNYKIACGHSHILQYSNIKVCKQELPFEYPQELEKQLVNNLVVGNPEACEIFLEKFFDKLIDSSRCLSDNEIKNIIYQLQTSILKVVSSLPISIKIDTSMNILNLFDHGEIKNRVSNFVLGIASEINKSDENKQSSLLNSIFEYIDKKFMHEDFNLNSAADALSLNRNYLAKIIKEKSGASFNEYINKKRIAMAKALLLDKNTPIENIAHQVGFNYSHYFIKVFKGIEGITPGQYRDKVMESSPADNEK